MKILPKRQNSSGVIQIFPLLAIAILIIGGIAFASPQGSLRNVLSDSDETESAEPQKIEVKEEKESEREESLEPEETAEPAETPEPEETPEAEDEEEIEVETEVRGGSGKAKIKINRERNRFEFQQEGARIEVESNFPLSVNPVTRELMVTTPAGSKTVTVLPEQAVENMLTSGIVSATSEINLQAENNGSLTYEINGIKNEKLLGVFGITIPKKLIVSAETGQVIIVNQSVFSRILDLLSI